MTTEATLIPEPQPFPVPDHFAFEWPQPEDAFKTWMQDRMHCPFPITPMSAWFANHFAKGFSGGLAANSIPMRADTLRLNTYFYLGINPAVPPEQLPELEAKAQEALTRAAPLAAQRWDNEWLPELQNAWAEWSSIDLATLSDAELATRARHGVEIYERAWTIHFEMLIPAMVGASLFEDAYQALYPGSPPMAAYALARGFNNMSIEAGRELWLIARAASADPALKAMVERTPAHQLWAALGENEAGRAIRDRLAAYLAKYGRRSDNVQELGTVSWTEDPAPAMTNFKAYVNDPQDPADTLAANAAEREQQLAAAREVLAGQPPEVRGQFEALLQVGQAFGRLQEDHNFWIDQRGTHEMRQLCMEIGRRLAGAGRLSGADDVMMLDLDEALAALAGHREGVAGLAASRRAEMDRWAQVAPPPMAGMDYGPPPDNPVTRAISRFFGGPPPESAVQGELRGTAGAPGKVTGIARIVMSIDDGHRLGQDEILVAPTTAPPWTPLFATAAAVVTETGAQLSHCAIVCREYGIPAVVGIPGATVAIRDGARIEVDGDVGIVRLLDGES